MDAREREVEALETQLQLQTQLTQDRERVIETQGDRLHDQQRDIVALEDKLKEKEKEKEKNKEALINNILDDY